MFYWMRVYAVTFAVFLSIDLVWLGIIAKELYRQQIGHLMKQGVNWPAAVCFYLLFNAGLVFFVLRPALEVQGLSYALLTGMFFGFVSYATYDLTNLAVAKDWPLAITLIDLAWGSVLGGMTSFLSFYFNTRFF